MKYNDKNTRRLASRHFGKRDNNNLYLPNYYDRHSNGDRDRRRAIRRKVEEFSRFMNKDWWWYLDDHDKMCVIKSYKKTVDMAHSKGIGFSIDFPDLPDGKGLSGTSGTIGGSPRKKSDNYFIDNYFWDDLRGIEVPYLKDCQNINDWIKFAYRTFPLDIHKRRNAIINNIIDY